MEHPSNAAEVVELVQRFYQPGQPQDIKGIEEHLQFLQQSEQGWQLADIFLQSKDRNVRFFGALTFTIKIKRDSSGLSEEERATLLDRLLQHLVRLVNQDESALVIKKLCNALVAYYLLSSTSWQPCVRTVLVSLGQGQGLPVDAQSKRSTELLLASVGSLGSSQILAILWFSIALAEEAKQALAINAQTNKTHEEVASNVNDVAVLLYGCLDTSNHEGNLNAKHVQEGMKCFQSWVMYAQRAWWDKISQIAPLQVVTPLAIQALNHEELYEEASELLSDVLSNFSSFLTTKQYDSLATLLSGIKVQKMIMEMTKGDYTPEAAVFARLCLAYGEARVHDLARRDDTDLVLLLQQLIRLLNHRGCPGVDDEGFCSQALEFWQTYVEYLIDSLFTLEPDQKPPWMNIAQQRVLEVLEICWLKIRQPSSEAAARWDSDERISFQAFRSDVQDILQTSYTLLGADIFEKFAWLALKALHEQAWLELEASLFCLNALSEAVSEERAVDEILSKLFSSSLFAEMTSQKEEIPAKTRQVAVTMITRFIHFFERHVEYLPAMLNFLFESLRSPALAVVAAKAIATACSSCREILTPELHAFIHQYELVQRSDDVDAYTKEKVIGGIAAIVQALPTDEAKVEPLRMLLHFVDQDVQACLRTMNSNTQLTTLESEGFQKYGICALKCIASIGKALQTPDDIAIDLDAEAKDPTFWTAGPGANLQTIITNITRHLSSLMPWSSDIMETACQILRSGYKENTTGLFVFHPQITVSFLLSATLRTSRLDHVLNTAGAMLSRQSASASHSMQEAASRCLEYSIKLLAELHHNPSAEPEVASSIIDLANKCIPHYVTSMIVIPDIEKLFNFTLACLASAEIMPNRSAAHFWAVFVQKYDLKENAANFQTTIIHRYAPMLCQILIHSIAGEVPRSRLDTLAEPLKKIVFAQSQAKNWLSAALTHPNFPSQKFDTAQKRVWLQKVMSLRGAKKTNNEVKDLWVACRGPESNFAF